MKKFFLLGFLMAVGAVLSAQTNRELIQSVSDAGSYAGYDVVTLYDSTDVFMEESGLSYVNTHKLIKILTPAGARDFNTVKMDYDPLSAYVEIRQVKIYHADGREEIVDKPVLDYPAPAHMIYWGACQKMVALGRLEPGDAVEMILFKKGFTYALLQGEDPDAKYIPPMRGQFYDIVPFWSDQPVKEKVYRVNALTEKNLHYAVYNGSLTKTTQNAAADARTVYTFVKKDIMPLKKLPYTLSNNDIQTKLLLSTTKDWKAKSLWFYGVNEDFGSFVPDSAICQKVNQLLKHAKNELDSISILTHWVADNVRYSGISMGKGEGFTLHKCTMDFTDRCGVCKDKAGMLIGMLRAAGFKAYPAMTMAGERIDNIPADQFNHCVTVVKLHNGKYMLLDPTWVPGVRELWSSAEQQQNYLMGIPEGADLGLTPVSAPEKHYVKMTANTRLKKNGTLCGTVTVTAEGQSDKAVRSVFYGRRTEWRSNVEAQLLRIYPNAVIKSVSYSDEDTYLEHPVKITYKFEIPQYAAVSDKVLIVTPFLAKGFYKFAMRELNYDTKVETREYPFSDRCSRQVILVETLHLPSGYVKYVQVPEKKTMNDGAISFEGGYQLLGSTVTLRENIRLGKRIYEASDWPAYRTAVINQKYYSNTPLIISK